MLSDIFICFKSDYAKFWQAVLKDRYFATKMLSNMIQND